MNVSRRVHIARYPVYLSTPNSHRDIPLLKNMMFFKKTYKNVHFFRCHSGRFFNTPRGPQKSYDEFKKPQKRTYLDEYVLLCNVQFVFQLQIIPKILCFQKIFVFQKHTQNVSFFFSCHPGRF